MLRHAVNACKMSGYREGSAEEETDALLCFPDFYKGLQCAGSCFVMVRTARVIYFRLAADTLLSVGSLLILAELQSVHEKKRNLRKKKHKLRNNLRKKRVLRRRFLSGLRQNGRPAGEPCQYP